MIPDHEIMWKGLFPFFISTRPREFSIGGYARQYVPEELWPYPEEEEAADIFQPTGAQTTFPILLTKKQLGWFYFKVKKWQATLSGSYNFTVEGINITNQYEGEFDFDIQLGRNVADDGSEIADILQGTFYNPYVPNEKFLISSLGRILQGGLIGTEVGITTPRQEVVEYEETETISAPNADPPVPPVVQTNTRQATLTFDVGILRFQEAPTYTTFAWADGPPYEDIGPAWKSDSVVACNFIVSLSVGFNFYATSAAPITPTSTTFPEGTEQPLNCIFECPWGPVTVPLYRPLGFEQTEADLYPHAIGDIVLTPIEFWEYQPPPE